ncbi:hypothetical protein HELRODRAFT_135381, partial [Helobdella robusta]|uniref:Receptor expression-enhancing protein n=1 Tax=Helobdella robusta TaxID=6412 RepID=T1EI85_HELRO
KVVRLSLAVIQPAYASYKTIKHKDAKEYNRLMIYWIVYAVFTCCEFMSDMFFEWFPFYTEMKMMLITWLALPCLQGSTVLYRKVVAKKFQQYEPVI